MRLILVQIKQSLIDLTKDLPSHQPTRLLAAGVLLQQNSIDSLNEVITYTKEDLVDYSPVTEKHVDTGMKLGEIAEAAVRSSDNTAGTFYLIK